MGPPLRLALLLAATAFALAACVTVVVRPTLLTEEFRSSPVSDGDVLVVRGLALDSIPEACRRVAVLQGSGQQDFSNEAELVAELRKAAGKPGGNVVAILSWEEAGRAERVLDVMLRTGVDRDAVALALRCPEDVRGSLAGRGPGDGGAASDP